MAMQGHSDRIRHLGKQTAIMLGGTAFTFTVGLPFQIYLARTIGASGLGLVGIAEASVLLISGFLAFGLAQLPMRFVPEYRVMGATRSIRVLLIGGCLTLATFGILGALFVAPLADRLPDHVGVTADVQALLETLRFLLPVTLVSFFLSQALRGFQLIAVIVLSTSILALLFKVLLTIWFFAAMGATPENYARAIVISQALAVLPMACVLWWQVRALPPDITGAPVDWRAFASFAGTAYASGLMSNLVGNLDRVVIGALLGPSAVGVLMVVRQLQQFPAVFQRVALMIVSPVFARLKAAGQMEALAHQLHLSNDWTVRLASGSILILLILPDHVLGLYGREFAGDGTMLLMAVVLVVAVNLGTGPVGVLLNMTGHHVALFRVSVLTSVLMFGGYFLLIPIFGLVGAGLSILLGNVISNGMAVWLVRRELDVSWYDPRFRGWILPSAVTAAFLLVMRPVLAGLDAFGQQGVVLACVAVLAYAVYFGVSLLYGLHDDDRELLYAVRVRLVGLRGKGTSET